jgi:transposase-like protein
VTEQQLARMAKRRLAVLRHAEEITGNVALTCRYYGISRQIFSTWRRRYDAHGLDGLRDRSHRPQVSPNATRTEVVGKMALLHLATTQTGVFHQSPETPSAMPRLIALSTSGSRLDGKRLHFVPANHTFGPDATVPCQFRPTPAGRH